MALGAVIFLACLLPVAAIAQRRDEAKRTDPIELSELADPPDELARLIKLGHVTLFSGRKPWSEIREARDRIGISGRGLRLTAETKFEIDFDYRSQMRWTIRGNGDRRRLRVTISFRDANLAIKHIVWFRHRPATDGFWKNELVRHEFDHVRLSSRSVSSKRFLEMLRESNELNEEISSGQQVDQAYVRKLVDKHVKKVFDEVIDLVSIRYKELDRITVHGQRPIPPDSTLGEWMTKAKDE